MPRPSVDIINNPATMSAPSAASREAIFQATTFASIIREADQWLSALDTVDAAYLQRWLSTVESRALTLRPDLRREAESIIELFQSELDAMAPTLQEEFI